jgi:hypothetical protein
LEKKRRKAKKPAIPMPSKDIEAGSGIARAPPLKVSEEAVGATCAPVDSTKKILLIITVACAVVIGTGTVKEYDSVRLTPNELGE